MTDIEKAKNILNGKASTCVLCHGERILVSNQSGISPIMRYIEQKTDLKGFSAADKIIGKATAMLFVLVGVTEVYAEVMSRSAIPVFEEHGVHYSYGILADMIVDCKGDGICPMEQTVMCLSEPEKAYEALKLKLHQLSCGVRR